MKLWWTVFWISLLCALPYFIFFPTFSRLNWIWVLVLAMVLGWITMYYVLLKAPSVPKKTT
jgi:hypothetical protein